MCEYSKRWLGVALGALVTAWSSAAAAQDWLEGEARSEGPGIRVGDLELHPGIGSEVGYTNNVFNRDAALSGTGMLRLTPHLYLSTLGGARRPDAPPPIQFRAGLSASLYHFMTDEIGDNIGATADGQLKVAEGRTVSLVVHERFTRTVRPFTQPDLLVTIPGQEPMRVSGRRLSFGRNTNEAGADVKVGTRSKLLTGQLGYRASIDLFDEDVFQLNDNIRHEVAGGVSWRFLPATALLYDARLTLQNFFHDADQRANTAVRSDSASWRSRVGINGALSNRLSIGTFIGYTVGVFERGDDFSGLIGQVDLTWKFSPSLNWQLGYSRDYALSFQGNFIRSDDFSTSGRLRLGNRLTLSANAGIALLAFGTPLAWDEDGTRLLGNTSERQDVRLMTGLSGQYALTTGVALTASFNYMRLLTDFAYEANFEIPPGPMDEGESVTAHGRNPARFGTFMAWLGLRVFY